jgi:hypothetical protein
MDIRCQGLVRISIEEWYKLLQLYGGLVLARHDGGRSWRLLTTSCGQECIDSGHGLCLQPGTDKPAPV